MAIRVLHVFGSLEVGGAEKRTLSLYRRLLENGHQVRFDVFANSPREAPLEGDLTSLGGQVYRGSLKKHPFRTLLEFLRLVRANQYDVVQSHVHLFSGAFVAAAYFGGADRRITHFRNTHDGRPETLFRKLYRGTMRFLIWVFSTDILGISRSALTAGLGRYRPDHRASVIYNGYNLETYSRKHGLKNLEQDINPDQRSLIITVARFVVQKNHRTILTAAEMLLKVNPGVKFLLVGNGPLMNTIRDEISTRQLQEDVIILGLRNDVPELLSISDVFYLPSMWEGLGGVYLEALACGLPVVASDIGPVLEIKEYFQDRVLTADALDPADQVGLMEQALKMGIQNPDLARSRFKKSPFHLDYACDRYWELLSGEAAKDR